MIFLIKNGELLEAYNNIWERVSNLMKKDLIVSVYDEEYLKTKTKSYDRKVNTNLYENTKKRCTVFVNNINKFCL